MKYETISIGNLFKRYTIGYPKFLLLFITFVIAYLLFYGRNYEPLHNFIVGLGYSGAFVAGILYSYGFTAAPATAIFLILATELNIPLAGFIGGLGALTSDLFIFSFIRTSFSDEIRKLSNEKIIVYVKSKTPSLIKKYLVPLIAAFVIASPLPDEIGVTLLAASSNISTKMFMVLCYVLNTAGIFVILGIGNLI